MLWLGWNGRKVWSSRKFLCSFYVVLKERKKLLAFLFYLLIFSVNSLLKTIFQIEMIHFNEFTFQLLCLMDDGSGNGLVELYSLNHYSERIILPYFAYLLMYGFFRFDRVVFMRFSYFAQMLFKLEVENYPFLIWNLVMLWYT